MDRAVLESNKRRYRLQHEGALPVSEAKKLERLGSKDQVSVAFFSCCSLFLEGEGTHLDLNALFCTLDTGHVTLCGSQC
jgi:hypothetical protein